MAEVEEATAVSELEGAKSTLDAIDAAGKEAFKTSVICRPVRFKEIEPSESVKDERPATALSEVSLDITVILGHGRMNMAELMALSPGSVVELDRFAGEPVEIMINDTLLALGEVVVVEDRLATRVIALVEASLGGEGDG